MLIVDLETTLRSEYETNLNANYLVLDRIVWIYIPWF